MTNAFTGARQPKRIRKVRESGAPLAGGVLGTLLGSYAPGPIIRERDPLPRVDAETPMTFAYGLRQEAQEAQHGQEAQEGDTADVERTASDPADSTRTARRDSLSQDEAAALLLQIDGEPRPTATAAAAADHETDATVTQELSGDDLLEAMEAVTVEVTNEPATLEIQHDARDTTRDLAPEPSGISLPPSPESTPTLPASEAPKTPVAAAQHPQHDAAPITVTPPSTMPTMIAPKSLGVPSRKHTDLFEDLARVAGRNAERPVMHVKQLAGALGRPILDLEAQPSASTVSTVRGPPSTRRSVLIPAAAASSPVTSVPRTQPYPFSSPIDPELSPVTEPASLPIPLMVATARTAGANDEPVIFPSPSRPVFPPPSAPPSVPLPLARLIEASIVGHGERPTLESAQPIAIAAAPAAQNTLHAPVRPLVLPDLSGAAPVQSAFDPRLAYVDYAEGLARRQKAERAAATRTTPRPRRSRALLVAFASFALLIAATLFCATVLILQQRAPNASYASQPSQPSRSSATAKPAKQAPQPDSARARTSFPQLSPMSQPSLATDASRVAASPLGSMPAEGDHGIPVLSVDLLPRVHNSHGVLHVGKQFDGHRVFVDGAMMGNGAGDYELLCGRHSVKIGAQAHAPDRARIVTVPCGGDVGL